MNVWIVQTGEPLPIEANNRRILRAGMLAEIISNEGHDVTWWSSAFSHKQRKHLVHVDTTVRVKNNYRIVMIYTGGYKGTFSLARLRNHYVLGKKFFYLAHKEKPPDIILCGLPTLDLSVAAARYGKERHVPVILDIRDLWPDAMWEVMPNGTKWVAKIATLWMTNMADEACSKAFGITGQSDGFVEWGLKHAKRKKSEFDQFFYFGYPDYSPSLIEQSTAKEFWSLKGVTSEQNRFIVCFIGNISRKANLACIIDTARILKDYPKILFVLCGEGECLDAYRKQTTPLRNIIFPGWVESPELWFILRIASIGVVPYLPTRDFVLSVPNKAPEYLSAGLPIALCMNSGMLFELINGSKSGFSYLASPKEFAEIILSLENDRQKLKEMSLNAQNLYYQNFNATKVYTEMFHYLERAAQSYLLKK